MDIFSIINKVRHNKLISYEELEVLLKWLLSDEGKAMFYEDVERQWNAFGNGNIQADYDYLLVKLNEQIDASARQKVKHRKKIMRRLMYAAEAAAVIFIAAGVLWFNNSRKIFNREFNNQQIVEIYNPKGLRTTITLPDSSIVTLNADSKISYENKFKGSVRAIKLSGEAFFDVRRDESKPFVVETDLTKITVLGTSFNVRAYEDDKFVTTSLLEGSLKVDDGRKEDKLKPGEQMGINKISKEKFIGAFDDKNVTGWMYGNIYLNSLPFSDIAVTLERAFNVNIEIATTSLARKTFTGKFDKGENLEQILEVMKLSTYFEHKYDKEANLITIK